MRRDTRQPVRPPSVEEISEAVLNLKRRLKADVKTVKPCLQG
jgi:hypothetical protein